MRWTLLLNTASTWMMVGVIWMVQWVHYPLFAKVGREYFVAYEASHTRWISAVVIPPMLLELLTSCLLVWWGWQSPQRLWWLVGLGFVCVAWLATFLLAVPQHTRLAKGFSQEAYDALLRANWWRTAAWSLKGLMMFWLLSK